MAEHKGRYIGSTLLLLLASMLLVTMYQASLDLEQTFDAEARLGNLSDAEFTLDQPIDAAALAAQFDADVELGGTADVDVDADRSLRVFSLMDSVNKPVVEAGKLPSADGEIMLDQAFADANGYAVGDTVQAGGRRYAVSGTGYLPNFIYIIKSKAELMADPAKFGAAVVARSDFAQLDDAVAVYAVKFHDRTGLEAQQAAVKNALRGQGRTIVSWQSTDAKVQVSYVAMEIQVMRTMSAALPGAMLALGCVLLSMLLWRTLKGESVVIGTLYAEGYTKAELRRHYLAFPLLVGLTGGVLGALLGWAASGAMFDFMLTAFPMPDHGTSTAPWLLVAAVALPLAVLCAVTWLVIGRVLRTPPAELMKGGQAGADVGWLERRLPLGRLGFPARFRIRAQLRSVSRTVFLLLGTVVATMLLLYGFTMSSSVDSMLGDIDELYNMKYEYVFTTPRTGAPPTGTEQFNAAYVSWEQDEDFTFYVTGVLPDTDCIRGVGPDGQRLVFDKVTLTAPLARKLGVGVGGQVSFFDTENWQRHTVTVEQLDNNYAGEFMWIPLARYNQLFGQPSDSYIGVWSQEQLSFPADTIASTKTMAGVEQAMRSLLDQIGPMIYTLIAVSFLIGLIVIYLATGLIVDENRGAISLLKVFGYRKAETNRLILDSSAPVVVVGYLLGVPALLATAQAFFDSLADSLQFMMPVKLNWWYVLAGFAIVLATYEVSIMLGRRRVNAIPMAEAVKAGTE
ncbi:MAG: ABC transporter permease [Propionibacteriaceae bacterium]|jgi:putative ABC transport system permease protein|nr:ABC transporter permease [Propionibacteriaceae bacterium]